jgi:YggT family protein
MITLIAITFFDLFAFIFEILLLIRVVLSYFAKPGNSFYDVIVSLTEPLLIPIRRVIPRSGLIDFSPFVAFILLQGVQYVIHNLINA